MANLPADRTVWLGGLPSWLSSEDLYSWASSTTWPVFCEVAWSMHSLTHGYCIYSTAEEAQEAVQQLPTGVAGYRVSKRPWKGKGDSKGAKAAAPGPAPGPAEAAAKAAAPAAPAGPAEAAKAAAPAPAPAGPAEAAAVPAPAPAGPARAAPKAAAPAPAPAGPEEAAAEGRGQPAAAKAPPAAAAEGEAPAAEEPTSPAGEDRPAAPAGPAAAAEEEAEHFWEVYRERARQASPKAAAPKKRPLLPSPKGPPPLRGSVLVHKQLVTAQVKVKASPPSASSATWLASKILGSKNSMGSRLLGSTQSIVSGILGSKR